MIASGLKKLALENGLTVAHGVAYGSLQGFAATLSEGVNYKKIVFATRFADPADRTRLMDQVNAIGVKVLQSQYRVTNLGISDRNITILFYDTVGTLKKMRAFLEWFVPLLRQYGASEFRGCPECGGEVDAGCWVMVNGICYYVHEACSERICSAIENSNEEEKQERTGSYLTGAVGAFLGSLVGAAVWTFVLYLGYIASIIGLLIGWLSEKGYTLLHGKQGKAKLAILILAIIFGVFVGTVGIDVIYLIQEIQAGTMGTMTYGDIPMLILVVFLEDAEYRSGVLRNLLMGLLFAALGVIGILKKTGQETSGQKFIRL